MVSGVVSVEETKTGRRCAAGFFMKGSERFSCGGWSMPYRRVLANVRM